MPARHQARIVSQPTGRLLSWPQFYARNRGWIQAQRVTLGHARGEVQFSDEATDAYRGAGKVVVATCHGGPISVKKSPPSLADTSNR